jgi:hypothetical protein
VKKVKKWLTKNLKCKMYCGKAFLEQIEAPTSASQEQHHGCPTAPGGNAGRLTRIRTVLGSSAAAIAAAARCEKF